MKPEKGESVETLSKDRLQQIRGLVQKDKTFAIFFEGDGVKAVPSGLRNILVKSGILPTIQKHILPSYKERAKILIA